MRRAALMLSLCALLLPAFSTVARADDTPTEREEELNLSVGENRTLPAGDVKSYSEGAQGIVQVKLTPDSNQFVLVGQRPGSTTLLLIKKDGLHVKYSINVFARPLRAVESELRELLSGMTGIRIRLVGSHFFIEGGVSTEPELKRIEQIASLYAGQVESLVILGGGAADRRLNIRVDFFFVQYDRTRGYSVGVSWPAAIGGSGVASAQADVDLISGTVTSAQASIANQVLPGLDIAANHGWAKVLKHSTVITANGSEANFSSGGEQNFSVASGLTSTIREIKFGTDVTVLPRFDPVTRQLDVKVGAEVSDLTPPVTSGTNLPGRNTSKLSTQVALKLGQSLVLSGIRTKSQRHDVNGIPLLSDIPILGVLFGGHSDQEEEVEGAVFVVPTVIESVPQGVSELVNEALTQYDAYTGNMKDVDAFDQDPAHPRHTNSVAPTPPATPILRTP
jgi:pilus assembly protein CpaC